MAIRLNQADIDRLEGLVSRIPIASRNAIAREALRLGIEALEQDPTQLVRQKLSGRKAKGSR